MLRYGIVGSGNMGQEHINNIRLLPATTVSAVADGDQAMREAGLALAGADAKGFTNHRDMMASGMVDVIVLASPNHTHIDILLDMLPADLPIMAEKPLCTTSADCRAVIAASAGRSAPVWVAMEYRYMPPVARLIDEVARGTVGALKMLSIREHRYPFLVKVGDWNRFARNTGGTMVEKCCHFFDLMRLITGGEAVRVFASGSQAINHLDERYDGETPDIIDNSYTIVEFDNGVRAMLDLCMFAEASRDQEEIAAIGDKGKVECGVPSSVVTIGRRNPDYYLAKDGGYHHPGHGGDVRLERIPIPVDPKVLAAGNHFGSTFYQHKKFFEVIKSGGTPEVTLLDGLKAVAIGEAAERSIRTGLPVDLGSVEGPAA
jgi:predicted dehydrogenase